MKNALLLLVMLPLLGLAQSSDTLVARAGTLYDQGKYEQALEMYYDALRNHEKAENWEGAALSLIGIGNVQHQQGKLDKSQQSAHRAVRYFNLAGKPKKAGAAWNLLGTTFLVKQDWDSALVSFELAYNLNRSEGNVTESIPGLHNIAMVYQATGRNSLALNRLRLMLHLCDSVGEQHRKCFALRSIGGNHAKNGRFDSAMVYMEKARELAASLGVIRIEAIATENLSRVASLMGDFDKAYDYHVRYKLLSDSMNQQSFSEKTAEMEALYESEKKQQKIDLQNEELKRKNTVFISVIGGLLLLVLVGWLWYNRFRLQQKFMLERQLIELEQKALRLQMNPHFIFNSLNTIQGFIVEHNHVEAKRYLSKFARLMRLTLESSREQTINLAVETEVLETYLTLAALRFDNKFSFSISAGSLDSEATGIPPMLVQPFVENAVVHGLAPKAGEGRVDVLFAKLGNGLHCTISDDGIGREAAKVTKLDESAEHKSAGMEVTLQRLEVLNAQHNVVTDFQITDLPQGTRIDFNLPLIDLWA